MRENKTAVNLLTNKAKRCKVQLSIKSVRGTAPMTTQQPSESQGANG